MRERGDNREKSGKNNAGRRIRAIAEAAAYLVCLTAFLLLVPGRPASADVIWTPDDSFYEAHYQECDYEGRRYYANSADGYVTVMESPVKKKVLDTFENGSFFFVSMTYEKGGSGTWGLVQYHLDESGKPVEESSWDGEGSVGWIKMEDFAAVYDSYSFIKEHAAEILTTDESTAPKAAMPENGVMFLWEYPGSELSYGELEFLGGEMVIDQTYEDPDGDLWGHSEYYYGYKNFWVNLSNPGEESPKVMQQETSASVETTGCGTVDYIQEPDKTESKPELKLPLIVGGLVVLAMALTAGVICFMAVKRMKEE